MLTSEISCCTFKERFLSIAAQSILTSISCHIAVNGDGVSRWPGVNGIISVTRRRTMIFTWPLYWGCWVSCIIFLMTEKYVTWLFLGASVYINSRRGVKKKKKRKRRELYLFPSSIPCTWTAHPRLKTLVQLSICFCCLDHTEVFRQKLKLMHCESSMHAMRQLGYLSE